MDGFRRDGLTFDVRDGGPADGDAVVLLHGFPQDSTAWAQVTPSLHQHGLRTLAPDQRGYSPMARPRGRACYRLRETVADVVALLDAADLETAHVVGHDWGGIVAWGLAAWHPDRVRTLTAVSVPHPAAMTKALVTSDQLLRTYYVGLFQLPFVPERLILADDGRALRAALRRGGLPDDAVDRYVQRMREPGALTAALSWYRALPWSVRDPVGRIRDVPTLHVWSTDDAVLGRTATEATAQFCDTPYRLEVLEGVSHWIPELASDELAGLVATHVRSG